MSDVETMLIHHMDTIDDVIAIRSQDYAPMPEDRIVAAILLAGILISDMRLERS